MPDNRSHKAQKTLLDELQALHNSFAPDNSQLQDVPLLDDVVTDNLLNNAETAQVVPSFSPSRSELQQGNAQGKINGTQSIATEEKPAIQEASNPTSALPSQTLDAIINRVVDAQLPIIREQLIQQLHQQLRQSPKK